MASLFKSGLILALLHAAFAANGPAFSTGPVAHGNYIVDASSTLVVPLGNTPFKGDLSLWCGMGTSKGDLIQALVERNPRNSATADTPCEDITDVHQWCGLPYVLKSNGDQTIGQEFSVTANQHVTFDYKYDDKTGLYTQYLTVNGKSQKSLSSSSGVGLGWGTALECAASDCGTVPAHRWVNTKITLFAKDPHYDQTGHLQYGATFGPGESFATNDGGLTWTVGTINVPEHTF